MKSFLVCFMALLMLSGCSSGTDNGESGFAYPYCDIDENEIDRIMGRMTLRQKIAQMYFVGVSMLPWDREETRTLIEDTQVGGVGLSLVTGLALDPTGTTENTNALQAMAMSRTIPVPLIIAVDQEGGIPQALCSVTGGTDLPGNMGLGATFDPGSTYRSYGIMGKQVSALGINTDFAPVLGLMVFHDQTSMYTRCFGEFSAEVSSHAGQAVRGLQENLVIATSKHFPSHSAALGDSHFVLPVNDDDEQTVRDEYLPPFIAAIEAGTDMMMTTHDIYKAWEETMPCTFSHRILTELLREELGFEGLIITDDMNMGAIMATEWDEHPDLLAIAAGADIILDAAANRLPGYGIAPGNLEYAFDVEGQIETIAEAVDVGRITEDRIDASVRRILRTKMKYCLFDDPYVNVSEVGDHLNTHAQVEASLDLHAKALTLVRNDTGLWPLDPAEERHVHVVCPRALLSEMYPDAAWQTIATSTLLEEVEGLASSVSGDKFDVDPSRRAIRKIVRRARRSGADVLVVGTYNALFYDRQKILVQRLLDLNLPTVLIALAMPYDLMAFPEASTYLAAYSNRDLALEATARALFGYAEPLGRLPVSMPGLFDAEKAITNAPLSD